MPEETKSPQPDETTGYSRPGRTTGSFESNPQRPLPVKAIVIPIICLVLAAALWYFFGPHKEAAQSGRGQKLKTVPVTVAAATTQIVPIEIRTTGNIQPYSVVNVVPQVGGQLKKVSFTQGQMVKAGDLLFQIDPRSYQAALDQANGNVNKDLANLQAARANLERDKANIGQLQATKKKDEASLAYANVEYQRYKSLVQAGAISMEQADQTMTSAATANAQIDADQKMIENGKAVVNADLAQIDTAKGTVEADRAVAANAKLQLDWCTIRAPMDGKTGSLQVYEGNIVAANQTTPLVTIAQVMPIYVSFTIPEEYLEEVRHALSQNTLNIQAMLEGVTADSVKGTASFLENTVNTTSGTALLRATFGNQDVKLYPGQFVDVLVTMPPNGPSIVVPASAIQTTQQGNAVYIVRDGKAQLVPVNLERTFADSSAIAKGVLPGDQIVTDGQLQLYPGAQVKIVTANGAPLNGGGAQSGDSGDATGQPGQGGHHHRHGGGNWNGGNHGGAGGGAGGAGGQSRSGWNPFGGAASGGGDKSSPGTQQ